MFKSKWKRKLEDSQDWLAGRAESFKKISLNEKDDHVSDLYWDVAETYADAARHVGERLGGK